MFLGLPIATAVLGVLIAVFEGMLQLNQFHENWIRYRSTGESLRHEKYIFLANGAPYSNAEKPRALLAERVESLVSQEHAKWATVQQQDPKGNSAQSAVGPGKVPVRLRSKQVGRNLFRLL
jgi:hypothetical protein